MNLNPTINAKFQQLGMSEAQQFAVGMHLLTAFSAAIGHRPYVLYEGKTYGNLCIVIIGRTGIGKGAACRYAKGIFSGYGEDVAAPMLEATNMTSTRTMLRAIDAILNEDARFLIGEIRLLHYNEEFGIEIRIIGSSYHSGVAGLTCRLVEGSRICETFGRQKIEYPLIHYAFVGHIQPEELRRCIRWHLITNGFVNRMLWYEMPADMTTPIPEMTQEIKTAIADDIEASINFAAAKRDGVKLNSGAQTEYDSFVSGIMEELSTASELMKHILPRFGQHVLKIALVLAMLRREDEINEGAMRQAIELVNQTRDAIQQYLTPPSAQRIEAEIVKKIRGVKMIQANLLISDMMLQWPIIKIRKAIRELEESGLIQLKAIDKGDGTFPKCYVMCN